MEMPQIISLIILTCILIVLVIYRDSRSEQRKMVKYFTIDKSAESYRKDIKRAHDYWTRTTGVKFIEQYKPFRTVVIFLKDRTEANSKTTVGIFNYQTKHIYVYNQNDFYGIILHEIGHSIGVAHNDNIFDVMYPTTNSLNIITNTSKQQFKEAQKQKYYLLLF